LKSAESEDPAYILSDVAPSDVGRTFRSGNEAGCRANHARAHAEAAEHAETIQVFLRALPSSREIVS